MNGKRAFADSNVPIYAYSMSDLVKQQKASAAILNNECVVSTQVLNEFCNVCLKKLHSLVVVSALESECEYLFSEDLSDSQIIDGLIIRNIFKV